MTEQEVKDEKIFVQAEYNALKKHLGELLLEHNAQEENPDDVAYFTRKFEETRKKLRR
jgi:hypothetical protein